VIDLLRSYHALNGDPISVVRLLSFAFFALGFLVLEEENTDEEVEQEEAPNKDEDYVKVDVGGTRLHLWPLIEYAGVY